MKEAIIIFGCKSRIGQNFINKMHNDFKIFAVTSSKKKNIFNTSLLKKINLIKIDNYKISSINKIFRILKKNNIKKVSVIFLFRNNKNNLVNSPSSWLNEFEDNVVQPYFILNEFFKNKVKLIRVVFTSSIYSKYLPPSKLHRNLKKFPIKYAISKSALNNLSKYLSIVYKNKTLFFNLILGGVVSPINKKFQRKYSEFSLINNMVSNNDLNFFIKNLFEGRIDNLSGNDIEFNSGFNLIR